MSPPIERLNGSFWWTMLTLHKGKLVFERVKPPLVKLFAVKSAFRGSRKGKQTAACHARQNTDEHTHTVNIVLLHKGASFPIFLHVSARYRRVPGLLLTHTHTPVCPTWTSWYEVRGLAAACEGVMVRTVSVFANLNRDLWTRPHQSEQTRFKAELFQKKLIHTKKHQIGCFFFPSPTVGGG